jgi:hypothetical protein
VDEVRGGSIGLEVGKGRRKDQHRDPRSKAEEKDNANHRTHQRGIGHEEIVGKANYYTNIETRELG